MKSKFNTLLLFATIATVMFLVLSINIRQKPQHVMFLKSAAIRAVEFVRDRDILKIFEEAVGDGNAWVVETADYKGPADEPAVMSYRKVIVLLPYTEKFPMTDFPEGEARQLLQLGKEGVFHLTLKLGDSITMKLGRETPSGTEFYVTTSSDPGHVYTVPNRLLPMLQQTLVDIRTRAPFYNRDLKQIQIDYDGRSIRLEQAAGSWRDASGQISAEVVSDLIKKLRLIRYEDYKVVSSREEAYDFGFALPDATITTTDRQGRLRGYEVAQRGRRFFVLEQAGPSTYYVLVVFVSPEALFKQLRSLVPSPD